MNLRIVKAIISILFFVSIGFFFWIKFSNSTETIDNQAATYVRIQNEGNETCVSCHENVTGFSKYHDPKAIGCVACHLGNPNTNNKEESHQGMVLIPGNLVDAEHTCGVCHPNELAKINTSLMTTNSGLVGVDKFIFGEADSPNYHYHIKDIQFSPSEKHIRDLCANCHLGASKNEFGAINELNRGGGCNACHLNYTNEASNELQQYVNSNKSKLPFHHPSTDINVTNEHCYGCHSRSSRISTNFEGWQETLLDENTTDFSSQNYKVALDKRVYKYIQEDIHHTKGMLCVDCHTSHEVMGDGIFYTHAEDAVKIQCADCHFKDKPNTITYDSLDTESLLVFLHRDYNHYDNKMIAVKKSNHPLVNTYLDSLGNVYLIGKKDKKIHPINPQPEICSRDNAHQNVSCSSCHSSWTSRCIGCHNEFDKDEPRAFDLLDKKYGKGQWKEHVAEFYSSLPALGVRTDNEKHHIEPAIPGMIMTIDKGSYTNNKVGEEITFHRLYAPNSPHTTVSKARDCKSCHNDAASLGFGMGELTYELFDTYGKWKFTPLYELNPNDQLPEDAWIPFLRKDTINTIHSTRDNFRPFTIKEQQNMLLVGSCLTCHSDDSKVIKESLQLGINSILKKSTKNCKLPLW